MFRSHPIIDRTLYFFSLPACYRRLRQWPECKRSPRRLAFDLLELFFRYKTFPDHYGPCRLWEVDKAFWRYYYGSNYQSYQRVALRKAVQPVKYRLLFDDKAVCEGLCRAVGVKTPHTYGTITPERNYRETITAWLQGPAVNKLFAKPLVGGGGRDIVLVQRVDDNITVRFRQGVVPLRDFSLKETLIVQEVVRQDSRLAAFSSTSVNTIRVVTMYTRNESVILLGATMRCGVGDNYVDNWSAGGVAIGVNAEDGRLSKFGYDKQGNRYTRHPTSKVVFDGTTVPEWPAIVETAVTLQTAFAHYRKLLGFDIALHESGVPIVIEVNDSPDLVFQEQTTGPLLRNEETLRAFGQYALLINRHQKIMYARLLSRDLQCDGLGRVPLDLRLK